MDIIKSYKKSVVENKSLVLISIFVAIFLRLGFYFLYSYNQPTVTFRGAGYLWIPEFTQYISGNIISFVLSLISALGIVLYLSLINSKYKLIRSRTYLVYVFAILLFSNHPVFVHMNPRYIATLLVLMCVDVLLSSYQSANVSGRAYAVGFFLALASLFSFSALMYLPVFWLGFKYMRCLKIKMFIASLFGLATVYWLAFFYFLWQGDVDTFFAPFQELYPFLNTNILNTPKDEIIILLVCVVFLVMMTVNYWTTSFRDKIQTRSNLAFIFTICVLSFLTFIFISYDPVLNLYIFISTVSLLLAHFFTLADGKWKVHMFYIFMTLYFIICIHFLLNKVITAILAV